VYCSLGIARQRAVRKVLFVGELPLSENYVGELPLCLHRIIIDTCQRGVCWVLFVCREVTFVRELRQGITFVFAWCHRVVLSSWAPVIVGTFQRAVRKVLFVGELPLSENYVRKLLLCLHRAIMDTRQRGVLQVLLVGRLPLSES